MWYIRLDRKPKSCEQCPLSRSEKWNCGKTKILRNTSSGERLIRVPDKRCKILKGREHGKTIQQIIL